MRLFVGIPLEESVSLSLSDLQNQNFVGPGFRVEPSDKLHITLVFIGEVIDPKPYIEALKSIQIAPFDILIDGVGKFVNRQVVYFAKICDNERLSALADNVLSALQSIDGNLRYKFTPHITLARANKNVPFRFIGPSLSMTIDKFILYESNKGQYIPLCEYGGS
jgi:2'-5' RNA ligase